MPETEAKTAGKRATSERLYFLHPAHPTDAGPEQKGARAIALGASGVHQMQMFLPDEGSLEASEGGKSEKLY